MATLTALSSLATRGSGVAEEVIEILNGFFLAAGKKGGLVGQSTLSIGTF